MKIDLSNIAYLKVDIDSFKSVSFFRRNGPLKSVTIPIREYRYLSANNYDIRIISLVTMDGKTISPKESQLSEDENAFLEEVLPVVENDFPSEKILSEVPQVTVVPPLEEPKKEAPIEFEQTYQKIDLLSTVHEEEDQINVRVLSEEEYSFYTKNELLAFLNRISQSLPKEVAEKLSNGNISKEKVMNIIRENVIG